ncbi:hypothetical protein CA3LBN_000032 [Candidozyma haemuli]|uniref:Glutaredoxin domain-containing protein n=1 Tax=Candidozyma haemuli TaxID=45357 RepID=A0ABX8HZ03_9ASCO|nr:hypothetical protein CA3LBN_000032 [[Candida] haemuloni]
MDIEEQIEKAEKLETPSLVGSSIRSADDSVHQNYIHPEKYKGRSKSKPKKHSILDSSIGASLDDLINEGALLGSEEDFDKFLDDTGKIKSDAKYAPEKKKPQEESSSESTPQKEAPKASDEPLEPQVKLSSVDPESVPISASSTVDNEKTEPKEDSIYENDDFSAPNLSEYQLDHQIADHSDLLSSVQSYDLSKLPSSNDRERSKSNNLADLPARVPSNTRASPARRAPALGKQLDFGENANIRSSDSLHSPYFASYERSPSRSRTGFRDKSSDRDTRSTSSSTTSNPHLARGDTYKNIHPDTPLKYERPADFDVDEEEEDSRATRHSKPTMGESIAAAEEENLKAFHGEQGLTRDPSLVTTGDYTNFNVDTVNHNLDEASLYSVRSESSTNYLRSISRSRSRQPRHNVDSINEKNDANHEELAQEGALISDDPFDQVEDLDNVMKNVVSPSKKQDASDIADSQKKPAEKAPSLAETSITEDAEPKATTALTSEEIEEESKDTIEADESSKDISKHDESSNIPLSKKSQSEALSEDTSAKEAIEEESEKAPVSDVAAEEKDAETKEQLIDESAPTVTANDIKIDDSKADHEVHRDIAPEVSEEAPKSSESVEIDESAEDKIKEAKEQLIAEEAPAVTAKDIKIDDSKADHEVHRDIAPEVSEEAPKSSESVEIDESAEDKIKEAKEQLIAEEAPAVTAKDIKIDDSKADHEVHRDIAPEVSEEAPKSSESVEIDESAEDKIKEAKEQLIAEEAPTVTAADIKLDKNETRVVNESTEDASELATEKDGKDNEFSATALESSTKSIVQEADEPSEKASAKNLDTTADDEISGTTESKEVPSEEEETKPNLVSEPVPNVSDKEEAKDIKAEEDPTPEDKDATEEEERKPSLITEGGIEEDEHAAEPGQKLDKSVDEEGNSVEEKSETVKDGVETDEHGAKVPVIDFEKEKENVAPETDAPATQPSLIGETANDDKELEAEDAEAAEATTGKDVPEPATVVEKERSKYDSEKDTTIEPASETALPKEAASTEPEADRELKKDEGDVVEEKAPETEGEIVDIKNDDVPTDSQKVKATEIVAEEEQEKQGADDESPEQESEAQESEAADAPTEETTNDAEEEEAAQASKETTKDATKDEAVVISTKEAEEEELPKSEKTSTTAPTDVKDDSEVKDKEVVQEKSTPQAASQGWFGSIKQGLGAVVGGGAAAAAADTKKDDEFGVSQEELRKHLQSLPVYIYTSLAGGMQIMQRTNRLTTILTANGVKFEYRDLGTDEEAKKIWRRYASGKTLPGVVRGDDFIGNWQEIDELNEEYMLTQRLWEEL